MSVQIIALFADWEPAVEAYRAFGTDFYWGLFERGIEEPPFAGVEDFGGFKRFLDTSGFYLELEDELDPADRERVEPFMRLIGAHHTDDDWDLEFNPAYDIVIDADGPPPEDPMMFAMRPAKVLHAIELARALPWNAIEDASGRSCRSRGHRPAPSALRPVITARFRRNCASATTGHPIAQFWRGSKTLRTCASLTSASTVPGGPRSV
jgi:hypothetical protein